MKNLNTYMPKSEALEGKFCVCVCVCFVLCNLEIFTCRNTPVLQQYFWK